MFFPKKDLSTVYADDRIKARKERLQFWYIISTFLLNFFQSNMILMLATNGSQYKLFHPPLALFSLDFLIICTSNFCFKVCELA